jgi:hypothetical protein
VRVAASYKAAVTDSQILPYNERLKAFSNYPFNLAAALTAASGARLWVVGGPDLPSLAWLAAALILLSVGSGLLHLLEPPSEEAV